MSRPLACAAAVAVLMLAGCGTRGGPGSARGDGARGRPPVAGRVTGRLLLEGGPIRPGGRQPGPRPIRGVVTFRTAGHRPVRVRAGRSGIFTVGALIHRANRLSFCSRRQRLDPWGWPSRRSGRSASAFALITGLGAYVKAHVRAGTSGVGSFLRLAGRAVAGRSLAAFGGPAAHPATGGAGAGAAPVAGVAVAWAGAPGWGCGLGRVSGPLRNRARAMRAPPARIAADHQKAVA